MYFIWVATLINKTTGSCLKGFLANSSYKKNPQSCAANSLKQYKHQEQRGQGMVEYVIIVALVAVAAIGVFQLFGQVIRSQTAAIALELAGEDGSEMSQQAGESAQTATEQSERKGLQNFTGNAQAGQ